LGLAETTPGPLVLVTEFVGFLADFRKGGEPELAFGLPGTAITLWATFALCFLWIFVGAPYIERLSRSSRLAGALAAVTAAVVSVILNLSLWFALPWSSARSRPPGTARCRFGRPSAQASISLH
jgi:chromate transporter